MQRRQRGGPWEEHQWEGAREEVRWSRGASLLDEYDGDRVVTRQPHGASSGLALLNV
jgi:hypothetical protein